MDDCGARSIDVAIVGLGGIAATHLGLLSSLPGLRLVAGCDIDPAKAEGLPAPVPFFDRHSEMLERIGPDVVVVAVPTRDHFSVARDCLESGANVLVEKPAALSLDQFDHLTACAAASNQCFITALHMAFGLEVLAFARALHEDLRGRLGPITGFESTFEDPYAGQMGLDERFASLEGSWLDNGVNALSVVASFVDIGPMDIEAARFVRSPGHPEGDVHATVRLVVTHGDTHGPVSGSIETSWLGERSHKRTLVSFSQTGFEAVLDHTAQTVEIVHPDGRRQVLHDFSRRGERRVNQYRGVYEDLRRRLANHEGDVRMARDIHRLLFAALETSDAGRDAANSRAGGDATARQVDKGESRQQDCPGRTLEV
jgi:predicted dehydrogenase